jgi:hypothetical protein
MEENQDQIVTSTRQLKPARSRWRTKKTLFRGLAIIIIGVAVLAIIHFTHQPSSSQKLSSKVTELQKKSLCSDGLKQLGPQVATYENSNKYSDSARETALNYLVNCSFLVHNNQKALSYAAILDKLYAQDGNTQKQQQLAWLINYTKNYGH